MKAFEIRDGFGLDHLVPCDRPEPRPPRGREVLVRITGMSLNQRDLMMVRGEYNPRQALPLIPLSDGAGVIEAIGEEVTKLAVGDRVMGTLIQGWSRRPVPRDPSVLKRTLGGPLDGVLMEYRLFPEDGVVKVPAHLSDVEAATLPCAGTTAWSALVAEGRLLAGETLLVQGTGGVALFALQIAKVLGARVIVTSKSDEKLARARALGADEGINYTRHPAWSAEVLRLTDRVGADHVLELGGAGTLNESLKAVRPGGHISVIGILAGGRGELSITPILMRSIRIQGVLVGAREDLEALSRAIELHRVRPVIDRSFPFDEARGAFDHLASARHFGKIAILGR